MKKYFFHNSETDYISGGSYWLRIMLQSLLYAVFGLGLYLQIVTIFGRARSVGMSFAAGVGMVFAVFLGATITQVIVELGIENSRNGGLNAGGFLIAIAFALPHLYLLFKNGKK